MRRICKFGVIILIAEVLLFAIVILNRQQNPLEIDVFRVNCAGCIQSAMPETLNYSSASEQVLASIKNEENTTKVQYTSGNKIFDNNGREVLWRGVGGSYLFHAGEQYQEAWLAHLPEIKAMGLNTFRLAFAFRDSVPNSDYGIPSADILDFEKMDWVLSFLDQQGIKGILDLHNYNDMYGDFGSQKLVENWRVVAEHYRGDPRVVAYELFNEPNSATWAPSVKSKMDVARFYANLTDAIREVDPEHIVIWNSQPYVPPLEEIADILRPNMVFTFHRWWTNNKEEFDLWTQEQISYMTLSYAVEYREKLNVPFWFGEFGSGSPFNSSNSEWRLTEQHLWRCEEQVIGWNLWMGRTEKSKSWNHYLPFFPLKVFNLDLICKEWNPPIPRITDYVLDFKGVDRLEPYRIELWHNGDYVVLKPGIAVKVIVSHKLQNGSINVMSYNELTLNEAMIFKNIEGTSDFSGDWNLLLYPVIVADNFVVI